jgi:tetratricopeptide (TPR) repeat protein
MRRFVGLLMLGMIACVPASAVEHLRLADGERGRGNDVRARNLYRQYLERYPGDENTGRIHYEIGRIHFDREDYVAAVREFTIVANEHPDDPVSWKALYYGGIAHARLGHCPEALQYLSVVVGGADGGGAPADLRAEAQRKMDEINDDMQGTHAVCTVKPPL